HIHAAGGTARMTGCCVSWKCLVACLPVEESQQPTWPHALHSRSATQTVPSVKHSSQAPGVLCGGKSFAVNPSKCSQALAIGTSYFNVLRSIYRHDDWRP